MDDSAKVNCPYCGHLNEMEIDSTIPSQRFVTDCETCCRPFEVHVECEAGEILSMDASAE